MSAYGTLKNIFKVIYAPQRTFREIMQNPKYIGPLLILIFFTVANTGFIYIMISKTHVEETLPIAEERDRWTENRTFWTQTPGVNITENDVDYINGTYYGNKSIEFSIVNSNFISMQLNDIGPVDCSEQEGYKNLSLRIKQISPESNPENVTIYLFSSTSSDYFQSNLTENFSNSTSGIWNNLTIPLGTERWLKASAADWGNIKGITLEFTWSNDYNITLLVDGLFFRGIFTSLAESASTAYMLNFSLLYVMQFVIQWVILSGLIYIMTKAFGAKTVWRPLLILVGFALVTLFVQAIVNLAAFSTLPALYYPLELIGGVKGESEIAYSKLLEETWLVSMINRYLQVIVYMWTILLSAITIRLLAEFPWIKSLLIATVAYLVSILAESFILGF